LYKSEISLFIKNIILLIDIDNKKIATMKTLFIVLIIPLVSSNIWDNIFGNFDAPTVVIPSEFTVTFGISPE
jgi:hypothetical protein